MILRINKWISRLGLFDRCSGVNLVFYDNYVFLSWMLVCFFVYRIDVFN